MKILFIQLPLLDHSRSYITGNIEYAPAAIAGYLKLKVDRNISIQYLPYIISCFGSNSSIHRYINNIMPDVISFTCYLWNIERNLNIAREIKESGSRVKIFMGGPEINSQSWALSERREYVDSFVDGEGEWFFRELAEGGDLAKWSSVQNGNTVVKQPPGLLLDSLDIVEPFTARFLNPMFDRSIFLELTRGCPYRCVYCNYSKNCFKVREIPFKHLLDAVSGKTGLDIAEIYILSPTFNRSQDFKKNLEMLAETNRGIKLHTEMRADGIDDATASLMYRAGFRSLEVGLQTLNRDALAQVGRRSDTDGEIRGMTLLRKAGIDLKIGIIPGLPGDTPGKFMETISTMAGLGFGDNIELYPLMVLPGTGIRDRADLDGVSYQRKPPYYFLEGWNFDSSSLREISLNTEDITGYGSYRRLPEFYYSAQGSMTGAAAFNGDKPGMWQGALYREYIDTNPFSFFIEIEKSPIRPGGLESLLGALKVMDQLFNIIILGDVIMEEEVITGFLHGYEDDHFFRRLNVHGSWLSGAKVKFFQVFSDLEGYWRAVDLYRLIEPIFKITGANQSHAAEKGLSAPDNILVARGEFHKTKNFLSGNFQESMDTVAFEDEGEQGDFYKMMGEEYINIALPFKMLRF